MEPGQEHGHDENMNLCAKPTTCMNIHPKKKKTTCMNLAETSKQL